MSSFPQYFVDMRYQADSFEVPSQQLIWVRLGEEGVVSFKLLISVFNLDTNSSKLLIIPLLFRNLIFRTIYQKFSILLGFWCGFSLVLFPLCGGICFWVKITLQRFPCFLDHQSLVLSLKVFVLLDNFNKSTGFLSLLLLLGTISSTGELGCWFRNTK